MEPVKIILGYLAVINLITCIVFGLDKWKAAHNRWRIREAVLLGLSAIGGSVGGLLAMYAFHHKTHKPLFRYGIPVILLVQIAALLLCLR